MYATDGDFGRVRLTSHVFPLAMQEAAACLSAAAGTGSTIDTAFPAPPAAGSICC